MNGPIASCRAQDMAGSVNQPQFALPLPKAVRKPNRDCPSPLFDNLRLVHCFVRFPKPIDSTIAHNTYLCINGDFSTGVPASSWWRTSFMISSCADLLKECLTGSCTLTSHAGATSRNKNHDDTWACVPHPVQELCWAMNRPAVNEPDGALIWWQS
jgi:hypothetical protein